MHHMTVFQGMAGVGWVQERGIEEYVWACQAEPGTSRVDLTGLAGWVYQAEPGTSRVGLTGLAGWV
jgi:hypothetical protein